MTSRSVDHDTMQARLAALVVRTKCNQHNCILEGCTDEHHPRDVDYLKNCLAMLGLPGTYIPVSDRERDEWVAWEVQSGRRAS